MSCDPELCIRRASQQDVRALTDLSRRTFYETFSSQNSPDDMRTYLESAFTFEKQEAEVLDPAREIYMAWKGTDAVGYIHFLDGALEECVSSDRPIEILRFYVDSSWHGTGVAHALMQFGIHWSYSKGYRTIWLGVWEKNLRAQAFYKKWLFQEVGSHIFLLGSDPQVDLVLQRRLV